MTIEARIEKDSVGPNGKRITTFVLRYPRFIHAEFMTHRMFSRNASSSRAIPVKTMIQNIIDDPAVPIHWGKNQAGMQANEEHENPQEGKRLWNWAMQKAILRAKDLNTAGFHKQIVNRILEPWMHIQVVCTATEYNNFFALRHHHMAQPEIAELAKQMWELYSTNTPDTLAEGEWHLPFTKRTDYSKCRTFLVNHKGISNYVPGDPVELMIQCSVARCARVSYLTHEGKEPTLQEDFKLYDRLLGNQPIHASPAEHQAMAIGDPKVRSGNLRGWIQYRKTLENENIEEFNGPLGESNG